MPWILWSCCLLYKIFCKLWSVSLYLKKLTTIQSILFYTTILSEILPLVFCILFLNKLKTKSLKVFLFYTITITFFSLTTVFLYQISKQQAAVLFVYRIFTICEFALISIFLIRNLQNQWIKKLIFFNILLFTAFGIIDYVIKDKTSFNNSPSIVSSLLLIFYIVYFFYEKMKTVVMYPLYQTISFWICVAFFLYFTGSFFYFLLSQSSLDDQFKTQMRLIYGMVTVSKNIILSLALFANEQDESFVEEKLNLPDNINLDEISLTNFKNP